MRKRLKNQTYSEKTNQKRYHGDSQTESVRIEGIIKQGKQ